MGKCDTKLVVCTSKGWIINTLIQNTIIIIPNDETVSEIEEIYGLGLWEQPLSWCITVLLKKSALQTAVTWICIASVSYCIFVAVGWESSWRDIRQAAWTMDPCAREEVNSMSQTCTYKTSHQCLLFTRCAFSTV